MKKPLVMLLILLVSLSISSCAQQPNPPPEPDNPAQYEEQEHQVVKEVVSTFGARLQMVSLQAPPQQVRQDLLTQYDQLITPELMAQWQFEPANAPGRLVSSPWPERIDISNIDKKEEVYQVKGKIIELTSQEKTLGGVAARQPIELSLVKRNDRWLIESVTLGTRLVEETMLYHNIEFGFDFVLPASWQGYTIVREEWYGLGLAGPNQGQLVARGPRLSIRHPQWSQAQPRQDIPILVFNLEQWDALQRDAFSIGAAPIGPKELARNSEYVFALPARYNFAFPAGFEEVESILAGHPLQPKQPGH